MYSTSHIYPQDRTECKNKHKIIKSETPYAHANSISSQQPISTQPDLNPHPHTSPHMTKPHQYVSANPIFPKSSKSFKLVGQVQSLSQTFFGSIPAAMPSFQLHCGAFSVSHVQ